MVLSLLPLCYAGGVWRLLNVPVLAGHAIGVIVADTEAAAQAAARAVEVTYTDIVPVLSIEQAIEAGSYFEVLHFTALRMQQSERFSNTDDRPSLAVCSHSRLDQPPIGLGDPGMAAYRNSTTVSCPLFGGPSSTVHSRVML